MKRLGIALILALAALGSVSGVQADEATGPNSIQAP